LDDAQAMAIAVPFFRRLGEVAASYQVVVCLEPNPVSYGANFMTTSVDTARIVREIDHPSIRMQLDSGAMTINGEDPVVELRAVAGLIGHVHASEPDLLPLGDGGTDHGRVFEALAAHLPNHTVSIEMVATKGEPHLSSMARALAVADRNYRNSANIGGPAA
jgi:sugar phosphate isomerase/epimerase